MYSVESKTQKLVSSGFEEVWGNNSSACVWNHLW